MKYSFIGLSRPVNAFNAILKEQIYRFRCENPGSDLPLEPFGVFASNLESAALFAANNDMRVLYNFGDVLKYSDLIFIFLPDKSLKRISINISKYDVKGKIFCHLSPSLCNDILNFNSYNTYASMVFTASKRNDEKFLRNGPVFMEGYGRRLEEFSEAVKKLGIEHNLIGTDEKRMYLTGVNFVRDFPQVITEIGKRLMKYSLADAPGAYDKIIRVIEKDASELTTYNALEFDDMDYLNHQSDLMDRLGIDNINRIYKAIINVNNK